MEKESVRIFQQNGAVHLSYSTLLSIAQARAAGSAWRGVGDAPRLVLDAEQVAQMGTATMQVLAGSCCPLYERGAPMRWQAVSPAVQQAAHLLGLDSLFGEPA